MGSSSSTPSGSIPCPHCHKSFESAADLRHHHAQKPMVCVKNARCTTEHGCDYCGGSSEHHRKATSTRSASAVAVSSSSPTRICRYCGREFQSVARLRRHHEKQPVVCSLRNYCTTIHGCYACEGVGEHYRKDNPGQTWDFGPGDV